MVDSNWLKNGLLGPNSSNILQVELLEIYQSLFLAKTLDIDELVCYSDPLNGINLIKGPSAKYHVHDVLVQDIEELNEQSNVTIYHTLWEGNQCVDFMA